MENPLRWQLTSMLTVLECSVKSLVASTDRAWPVAADRNDARRVSSLSSPSVAAAPTPNSTDSVAATNVASSSLATSIHRMCVRRCATTPTCPRERNVCWHFSTIDVRRVSHGHSGHSTLGYSVRGSVVGCSNFCICNERIWAIECNRLQLMRCVIGHYLI